MNNVPAVVEIVAVAKVRKYLAGLRGYNPMPEAEGLLARALQSVAVSVSHADAILEVFDELCPTPREIKEQGWQTREKFLPKQPSQREQWEKEYGQPQPAFSKMLIEAATAKLNPLEKKRKHAEEVNAIHIQALRDAVYYSTPAGQAELYNIQGKNERASSKGWWSAFIQRCEQDHPQEMADIRAGREPVYRPVHDRERKTPSKPEIVRPAITAETIAKVEPTHVEKCAT